MPFIRYVRTSEPGDANEHVVGVRFSTLTTGPMREATREAVHASIRAGNSFRTFDDVTNHQADVVARTSARGTRYISTVANGRETDNLLRLPRF